jgi:hypothetical protein
MSGEGPKNDDISDSKMSEPDNTLHCEKDELDDFSPPITNGFSLMMLLANRHDPSYLTCKGTRWISRSLITPGDASPRIPLRVVDSICGYKGMNASVDVSTSRHSVPAASMFSDGSRTGDLGIMLSREDGKLHKLDNRLRRLLRNMI